jgi:hypothetical protein
MKHLNRKLKSTGARLLLLSISFLLVTAGKTKAQCFVDLQAVSIDPSALVISTTGTAQLVVVMKNNGPCILPTGEAQVQITFGDTYLQPAVPLNLTNTTCAGVWTFVGQTNVGGQFNMFFRNNGGPLPVGGAGCEFRFNVGGRGLVSPGPVNVTLASTLTAAATSSDVDGSNQSASTQVFVQMVAPVTLADFNVTALSCNGVLDWKTSTEENVSRFEIQYSTNGSDFSTVGTVTAKNNPNGASYKYANAQGTAKGYYRLKIVDIDGNFIYSRIIAVNTKCDGKKSITMYPNPLTVNQNLTVIASGFEGTVKGELISMAGQVIRTYNLKNGTNTLPVDKVAQATYMLRVSDAAGDVESFRVVIMK